MTETQYLKNLSIPSGKVDVVLDTDAYNEIDDQFAIAYLIKSPEKLNLKALYAAPFYNSKSTGPKDGMEKSYAEILKLLELMDREDLKSITYTGSTEFMKSETDPVISDSAKHLAELAKGYSPENPLYVVAIGAITNVASAILMAPEISENIVVVWLGGHSRDYHDSNEFNMQGDIAAARVVFASGAPVVQLPCWGVVSEFRVSPVELDYYIKGKNKLCTYLADNVRNEVKDLLSTTAASRVIWDVTAVAWLLNDNNRFMLSRKAPIAVPQYNHVHSFDATRLMEYVYYIKRDALVTDLFNKLTDGKCFE